MDIHSLHDADFHPIPVTANFRFRNSTASNPSIFQWVVSLVSPTRPCVDAMGTPGIDGEVPGGRRSPVDMDIYGPSLRTIFVSRSIKLIYSYVHTYIYIPFIPPLINMFIINVNMRMDQNQ